MPIAREGIREIAIATIVLTAMGYGATLIWWPLAIPLGIVWLWVISFFRDPVRVGRFEPGDLCSPADGTVTEVTVMDRDGHVGGPAIRVGIFLSLFNVHVNRMPCSGRVRTTVYKKGEFLDARHPESGERNEANLILFEPDPPLPGPVVVRQVAGRVARRIICHAQPGDHWERGGRFGLIKFGSRTELIVPWLDSTEVCVKVGDRVRGGLTVLIRQLSAVQRGRTVGVAEVRDQDREPAHVPAR